MYKLTIIKKYELEVTRKYTFLGTLIHDCKYENIEDAEADAMFKMVENYKELTGESENIHVQDVLKRYFVNIYDLKTNKKVFEL